MTLLDLATRASRELQQAGIPAPEAALDAELLARHALQWDRATWLLRRSEAAPEPFESAYRELIARRATREPLAYIRGVHEFWGRDFTVSSSVLIPRPETELLIEQALDALPPDFSATVIDVGAGTGCIAITIALERPRARVISTDVSEEALAVAEHNAIMLGATNVTFARGPYFANHAGPFDVIVANPPYVPERDRSRLAPEVGREPAQALFAGEDGLRNITELVRLSEDALVPGGTLFMEIGFEQDRAVADLVRQRRRLRLVRIAPDLQGIPRVVVVERISDAG